MSRGQRLTPPKVRRELRRFTVYVDVFIHDDGEMSAYVRAEYRGHQ